MYLNSLSFKQLIDSSAVAIIPYDKKFQGPNLYYCHLGGRVLVPRSGLADTRDLAQDLYEHKEIGEYYDLKPGEFILAETFEEFSTDTSHAIRLFNSSSLARLGVSHCAQGMINPGCGVKQPIRLTLELVNNSNFTVRLYPTKRNKNNIKWGTEVLKIAIVEHEKTDIAYEDWRGALYGSHEKVQGSLIDKRFS